MRHPELHFGVIVDVGNAFHAAVDELDALRLLRSYCLIEEDRASLLQGSGLPGARRQEEARSQPVQRMEVPEPRCP